MPKQDGYPSLHSIVYALMTASLLVLASMNLGVDPALALGFHPRDWIVESAMVRSLTNPDEGQGVMAVWRLRKGAALLDVTLYQAANEKAVRQAARNVLRDIRQTSSVPSLAPRDEDLVVRGGSAVSLSPRSNGVASFGLAQLTRSLLDYGSTWARSSGRSPVTCESLPLIGFDTNQVRFPHGPVARAKHWYFHSDPVRTSSSLTFQNQVDATVYVFASEADAKVATERISEPLQTDPSGFQIEQHGSRVVRLMYHFADGRKAGADPSAHKIAEKFLSMAR